MIIQHKKHFHLERKQEELYLLLQNDPKLFWKGFEEKDDSTLPFTPQEAMDYYTKLYTSRQSINDHFVSNTQFPNVFTKREIWAIMKYLGDHKARGIHGLKLEFLKWVTSFREGRSTVDHILTLRTLIE